MSGGVAENVGDMLEVALLIHIHTEAHHDIGCDVGGGVEIFMLRGG